MPKRWKIITVVTLTEREGTETDEEGEVGKKKEKKVPSRDYKEELGEELKAEEKFDAIVAAVEEETGKD
jgi:hypothetical protein